MRNALLLASLLWLSPCLSQAQEAPQEPPGAVSMTYQGVQGVWLPESAAREALARWREYERMGELIQLLERRLQLQEETISILRTSLVESQEDLRLSLETIDRLNRRTERKWYEHPMLWLTIGTALGITTNYL